MMIQHFVVLAICTFVVAGAAGQPHAAAPVPASHILISYNVRVDVASDGENAWPHRADRVAALLRFHQADVAGLQEAKRSQIDDLAERLPEYGWYGVGRDDGADGGEFAPVFYRRDRYRIVDRGTFWLSTTPQVPGSVGWDAALPRVTSWLLLEDSTGARFYVYNTHFDHMGDTARTESARLVRSVVDARGTSAPAVAMGDFNSKPEDEPYRIMTGDSDDGIRLEDAFAGTGGHYGPDFTFGTFTVGAEEEGQIDYIFLSPGVSVVRAGTLTDQLRGRYPSDHLPVLAEIRLGS